MRTIFEYEGERYEMGSDLDRILRLSSAGMPVGRDSKKKAAQRKTARGKRVSREIGKAHRGIQHRRKKKLTW